MGPAIQKKPIKYRFVIICHANLTLDSVDKTHWVCLSHKSYWEVVFFYNVGQNKQTNRQVNKEANIIGWLVSIVFQKDPRSCVSL